MPNPLDLDGDDGRVGVVELREDDPKPDDGLYVDVDDFVPKPDDGVWVDDFVEPKPDDGLYDGLEVVLVEPEPNPLLLL